MTFPLCLINGGHTYATTPHHDSAGRPVVRCSGCSLVAWQSDRGMGLLAQEDAVRVNQGVSGRERWRL